MWKISPHPSIAILTAFLTACGTVLIEQPFPLINPPVDKDQLEGSWQINDGFIVVAFDTNGMGHAAGIGWDTDRFKLEEFAFITAAGPRNRYLCLMEATNGIAAAGPYGLARYQLAETNRLTLTLANPEVFAHAVSNGVFRGSVERGSGEKKKAPKVILTDPPERLLQLFDDPAQSNLFTEPKAMTFRKAIPADEPERKKPPFPNADDVVEDGKPSD
jgi:hypothetical protein